MKKLIYYLTVGLLISLNSCANPNDDEIIPKKPFAVDSLKALSGTFIDFWGKENWSQQEWDGHFQEMKELGMNTVIIQFVSYGNTTWFSSNNTFAKTKYPNALPRLLSAANTKNISVYIGLYFNDEYWENQTNVEWLHLHADRCIYIATEINTKFGKDKAFKGWYIPHEPEPYAYNTAALIDTFNVNFINRISDKLHSFDSKPVSIAAFFNSVLTSTIQMKNFMKELCKSNLQVIMLQDGVGVNHVSVENVGQYYTAADQGLYENTNYKGAFWTDLETFSFEPQGPVTISRIKKQLQAEMATPHISKAVSFQYYADMCSTGPGGTAAGILRNDYFNFIQSLK